MAIETRSRFSKSIVPGLFALMTEEYKRYPEVWRDLVDVRSSKRAYEENAWMTGYGVVPIKAEGAALTYDARVQGYTKRWTHNTSAMGARITEEAIEDDLYGVMRSAAKDLGVAARETRHIRVAAIFNTGFGTGTHSAGDGLAIFSGSHTWPTGSTWSNLATASALSYSTLQAAILAFEAKTDARGKKFMQTPTTLLVPPALEMKARQLLESVGTPEDANNSINAIKSGRPRLRMVVWNHLTSPTAWFLLGEKAQRDDGLIVFERVGVSFTREGDFDTGDAKFKVRWRDSVEVNNPIELYGNAGA